MNNLENNTEFKKASGIFAPERIKIAVFFMLMSAGLVISFLLPLRPNVSQIEKRALSAFPAFSTQSLFNGSYFKGIDLWFSDTFPFRERIMSINGFIHGLYGANTVQIKGDVEKGDEIPDIPAQTNATQTTGALEETTLPVTQTTLPEEPTAPAPDTGTSQTFDTVLLYGSSAYEYYTFRTDMAKRYAAMINGAASKLTANFYEIIVPNSTGIMLPESMKTSINSSDQKKATDYMYGLMDAKVRKINVYDSLIAHNTEYIYFRTDHHWTALGAYYGYEQWAKAKGVEPVPLSKYEKVSYEGFLGSFYASTNKSAALGKTPDTVEVFKPFNNTQMSITDKNGKVFNRSVVSDVSNWDAATKYSTFIDGDNPYSVIENKDLTDGSSCLVVKESYANAFIPFLIPHYQTIYLVDYRYWNGNAIAFSAQNGIKDVLYINNISATRSEALIASMETLSR